MCSVSNAFHTQSLHRRAPRNPPLPSLFLPLCLLAVSIFLVSSMCYCNQYQPAQFTLGPPSRLSVSFWITFLSSLLVDGAMVRMVNCASHPSLLVVSHQPIPTRYSIHSFSRSLPLPLYYLLSALLPFFDSVCFQLSSVVAGAMSLIVCTYEYATKHRCPYPPPHDLFAVLSRVVCCWAFCSFCCAGGECLSVLSQCHFSFEALVCFCRNCVAVYVCVRMIVCYCGAVAGS